MKILFASLILILMYCQPKEMQHQQVKTSHTLEKEIKVNTSNNNIYPWKKKYSIENKLQNRIPVPIGFERLEVDKNSYEDWLRNVPLKKGNPKVFLYNKQEKNNQTAQFAVLDIDVGNRDLQQCADALMRLRAEYLFSTKQKEKISFNFTSGDKCAYSKWEEGYRPKITGNKVSFNKSKEKDSRYQNFKNYLNIIFTYCGTHSLEKELKPVKDVSDIKAGDIFIQGGFPGHAVIVVDVAENTETNETLFLLAQSYMPAQDMHILKNLSNNNLSPWYSINFGETLQTPEWTFNKNQLKRF